MGDDPLKPKVSNSGLERPPLLSYDAEAFFGSKIASALDSAESILSSVKGFTTVSIAPSCP